MAQSVCSCKEKFGPWGVHCKICNAYLCFDCYHNTNKAEFKKIKTINKMEFLKLSVHPDKLLFDLENEGDCIICTKCLYEHKNLIDQKGATNEM